MNRFTASTLALALAATTGTASAQSYGYGDASVGETGYDDYARVVRVDPVIESGYGNSTANSQRCYSHQDTYAGSGGGYYDSNGNYHANNSGGYYGSDGSYHPGSTTGRTMATVIGGVLGAAVGSQVGGGSARYATAAIGSMVGGMAGQRVYENAHQPSRTGTVTTCDPVPASNAGYATGNDRVTGYDVTYEYAGRTYTTRTSYNPGQRIRVRVDVRAE